jgi:hypothetical protein
MCFRQSEVSPFVSSNSFFNVVAWSLVVCPDSLSPTKNASVAYLPFSQPDRRSFSFLHSPAAVVILVTPVGNFGELFWLVDNMQLSHNKHTNTQET